MEASQPSIAHSRVKEKVLTISTVLLFVLSFVFIVYVVVFSIVYTQALYGVERFQIHHDKELKYFRFAWLSEQVCNNSKPASFVTINCNTTSLFNSTSRYNPQSLSITESFHELKESSYALQTLGENLASYTWKVTLLAWLYKTLVGPWLILILIPISVVLSCMLPYITRKLLRDVVSQRRQMMKEVTRSMETIMQQEYRGSNNNVNHHSYIYKQQSFTSNPFSFDIPRDLETQNIMSANNLTYHYGNSNTQTKSV